jgi:phage baseplate assembly protein W
MRAISLPFRIDGYGRVASTTDLDRINQNRVRSVLLTSLGERLMRPTFGTTIAATLFDACDEAIDDIETATVNAFAQELPGLAFEALDVLTEDPESGTVEIEITYRDTRVSTARAPQTLVLEIPGEDL